jgi:uncharacterized membrane protein
MIIVHGLYDLNLLDTSSVFSFVQQWGGVLFFLLSGICVTLGHRHIRRGLLVLGCGMLCTATTACLYLLGLADKGLIIYFGVLHCLGASMLLWQVFSRLNHLAILLISGICIAAGFVLNGNYYVSFPWLLPFGFQFPGFSSADFFPLLPNIGYFLLGTLLGYKLYQKKVSLFPNYDTEKSYIRFLCWCGSHSLPIYLLHQPALAGLLWLFSAFYR